MQTLSIDMDEVITDTAKKLRHYYSRDFGITFTDEEIQGKDLKQVVTPEHFSKFHEYLNEPGFFGDLEVMPDAREVLKKQMKNMNCLSCLLLWNFLIRC